MPGWRVAGMSETDTTWEFAGSLDRLSLLHVMLSHPYLPVNIEVGDSLLEVAGYRYTPNRGGVVLLLHEATLADLIDDEEEDDEDEDDLNNQSSRKAIHPENGRGHFP
jgi:hypothetical protein